MNDEITSEKIEALRTLLREKMTAAREAGATIVRGPTKYIERNGARVCCCVLGSVIADMPTAPDMKTAKQYDLIVDRLSHVYRLMSYDVGRIYFGFDDIEPQDTNPLALRRLGHDLAVEFIDTPATS